MRQFVEDGSHKYDTVVYARHCDVLHHMNRLLHGLPYLHDHVASPALVTFLNELPSLQHHRRFIGAQPFCQPLGATELYVDRCHAQGSVDPVWWCQSLRTLLAEQWPLLHEALAALCATHQLKSLTSSQGLIVHDFTPRKFT